MDEVTSARNRADPNIVNDVMFARHHQGPGVHLVIRQLAIERLRTFLKVGMRPGHFAYLFHWSL
jgi:hypothetical protein